MSCCCRYFLLYKNWLFQFGRTNGPRPHDRRTVRKKIDCGISMVNKFFSPLIDVYETRGLSSIIFFEPKLKSFTLVQPISVFESDDLLQELPSDRITSFKWRIFLDDSKTFEKLQHQQMLSLPRLRAWRVCDYIRIDITVRKINCRTTRRTFEINLGLPKYMINTRTAKLCLADAATSV